MSKPIREISQSLTAVGLALITYTSARLLFYGINYTLFSSERFVLADALLTGMRFDIATITYTLTPGILALLLGFGISEGRLRIATLWLITAPQALALMFNFGDIAYYRHTYRRQTDEIFSAPAEAFTATAAELFEWWWLLALLIALIAGFHTALKWALKRIASTSATPHHVSEKPSSTIALWLFRSATVALLLALSVIAARGGLQNRPLRPAMAFNSDDLAAGHLSLNSFYTALWSSVRPTQQIPELMDDASARAIVVDLFDTPDAKRLSPDYPFLRRLSPVREITKPPVNVVLLIFESWNASQTGSISGASPDTPSLTPVFDSLARSGLLFTNFAANGSRSIHAFPAILASLANLTGDRLIHSALELNQIRGLGSILQERGYSTSFAMGAEPTSMGFASYARACGFTEYISLQDFNREGPEAQDPNWGVYDAPFLHFIQSKLASRTEPFAQVFFSLTSHSPYTVPPSFAKLYPLPEDPSSGELQRRGLRYADFALGEFMKAAAAQPYFARTLFVITADHVGWQPGAAGRNQREKFHIPLLLYAPGIIEPGVDTAPASQIDILPTIVGKLNIETTVGALGRAIRPDDGSRYSISASGSIYNFATDSLLLVATADSALALYKYRDDTALERNLLSSNPDAGIQIWRRFAAYYQTAVAALVENRVYPPPPLLDSILRADAGRERL